MQKGHVDQVITNGGFSIKTCTPASGIRTWSDSTSSQNHILTYMPICRGLCNVQLNLYQKQKWVACRKNANSKIFVIVIPKERFLGRALPILLLIWHWPYINVSWSGCVKSVSFPCIPGHTLPANPSFGMTGRKTLKDAFLLHSTQMSSSSKSRKEQCDKKMEIFNRSMEARFAGVQPFN